RAAGRISCASSKPGVPRSLAALRALARRRPHLPARGRHHRDVDCAELGGARGQLGAIAVIRTFLNFFLERDLAELRDPDSLAALARPTPASASRGKVREGAEGGK